MNSFIVHISDAKGIDARAAIKVEDSMDLGRAAQLALDSMLEAYGRRIVFPIFVDIHPATEFEAHEEMYPRPEPLAQVPQA